MQHHTQSTQQGPPPTSQHPRSASIIQQHNIEPPHQSQHQQQAHPGAYGPPHASSHNLGHQQPPYIDTQGPSAGHPSHVSYYSQSPYSAQSTSSNYSSGGTPGMMAAAHTMRPLLTPLYPQSQSPASAHSPHDPHGRGFYGQHSQQPLPYGSYPVYSPQQYAPHPSMAPHPMAMPYQQPQQQQPQQPQYSPHPQPPIVKNSPRSQNAQPPMQRPVSAMAPPQLAASGSQGSPGALQNNNQSAASNPNAAPGPIPATTPLVVKQDRDGVQWIMFEYSRDRIKMEYMIRCDVESVNVDELDATFKAENCVYPRACKKEEYRGNRIKYETDCNTVGWALAKLNPNLRSKRGLIQRAVDSWRNSNQDQRLRSRRVRRLAKITKRGQGGQTPSHNQLGTPGSSASAEAPGPTGIAAVPDPGHIMSGSQLHHHQAPSDGAPQGAGDDGSVGVEFKDSHRQHLPTPNGSMSLSPTTVQSTHSFYPTYPTSHNIANGSMPQLHNVIDHLGTHTVRHTANLKAQNEAPLDGKALFGDLLNDKKRSFFLIEDVQECKKVRVNVKLQDVNIDEMPDNHCKKNSVYPRAFFPRHDPTPVNVLDNDIVTDDEIGSTGNSTSIAKTLVPVSLLDGSEAKVPIPKMTRAQVRKEQALNMLGYRMAWRQNSQLFSGRTMFLQRSLDTYRQRTREALIAQGHKVLPHFKQRVGKLKWQARMRQPSRDTQRTHERSL